MAYVNLNPIRAGIACNLMGWNTSIRLCCKAVRGNAESAGNRLLPIWGTAAPTMPPISAAEYIEWVDDAGRRPQAPFFHRRILCTTLHSEPGGVP